MEEIPDPFVLKDKAFQQKVGFSIFGKQKDQEQEVDGFLKLLDAHYSSYSQKDPGFRLPQNWRARYRLALENVCPSKHHFFCLAQTDSREGKGIVACYHKEDSSSGKNRGIISELYVVPDARRSGLGHRLLQIAEKWIKKAGVERIELSTPVLAEAQNFWEKQGYHKSFFTMVYPLRT